MAEMRTMDLIEVSKTATLHIVIDPDAFKKDQEQRRKQEQRREDLEYEQYGRVVAERLRMLGRGHRYRLRKYRRKSSEIGWLLARRDMRAWLKRWHVQAKWVVGLVNTTQLRDGSIRESATIISCGDSDRQWQVAVPEQWPRQGVPIPAVLS